MKTGKLRLIIFGCGSAGQRAYHQIKSGVDVIGFTDNNRKLHGTRLFGLPVHAPADLLRLEFDRVYLASTYHREIRRQLIGQVGIPAARIELSREFIPLPLSTRLIGGIKTRIRAAGLPADRFDLGLWRLRGKHAGRRAFIIGNGPSLRMEDLDLLHRRRELCFGSNKIYLAFDKTPWRPDYYGIQDRDTPKQAGPQIQDSYCGTFFLARYIAASFRPVPGRVYFNLIPPVPPPMRPRFSFNLLMGVACGRTITYPLLQLACWMGVKEVYLLGVDFNYGNIGQTFDHAQYSGIRGYTYQPDAQNNYFVKDYHKPGETILMPYMEHQLTAYQTAADLCDRAGPMRIFNATRGGKLEVFERVDFGSLFGNTCRSAS